MNESTPFIPVLVDRCESEKFGMTTKEEKTYESIYDIEPLGTQLLLEIAEREMHVSDLELKDIISKMMVSYIVREMISKKYIQDYLSKLNEDELVLIRRNRQEMREKLEKYKGVCVSNSRIEKEIVFNEKYISYIIDDILERNEQFRQLWFADIDKLKKRISTQTDTDFLTILLAKGLLVLWLKSFRLSIQGRNLTVEIS